MVPDRTFIFADSEYKIACEGRVTAWEFCYSPQNQKSVTFYPSIWNATEADNNGLVNYTLIRSNEVTYDQVGNGSVSCQTFSLPEEDQFIAPAGSVIGFYSNLRNKKADLLRTHKAMRVITTYQYNGNQSSVQAHNDIGYNIALRVHLGKCL